MSSAVKERPILMSEAMVRACLDGTKTQTRRVVKNAPKGEFWRAECVQWGRVCFEAQLTPRSVVELVSPYGGVGAMLWVRETFFESNEYDEKADAFVTYYRSTDGILFEPDHVAGWHWRPSIFMPRRLSRLTLAITAIRIERVQDITEADALAEGVASVAEYRALWDQLNAERGYGWGVNPWVWVVSFARIQP